MRASGVAISGFTRRGLLVRGSRRRCSTERGDAEQGQPPTASLVDQRPSFHAGDQVVAANNLRGWLRPYVRRGTRGFVTVRTVEGHYVVEFSTGRTCIAEADQLAPLGGSGEHPPDGTCPF